MSRATVVRRQIARAVWAGIIVIATWGLLIAAGKGYSTFKTRLEIDPAGARQRVEQWDCVADVVDRLAGPDEAFILVTPTGRGDEEHYIRQRVVESVYPRVDLVVSGGTGTLVVTRAEEGSPGERCGDVVVRIDR